MRAAMDANIVFITPNTPPIAITTATITMQTRKLSFDFVSSL